MNPTHYSLKVGDLNGCHSRAVIVFQSRWLSICEDPKTGKRWLMQPKGKPRMK
jgi:hypothetical protein